jgi:DNA-binding CsgD family transcriptional regulator
MTEPAASNPDRLLEILGNLIGLLEVREFRAGLLRALRAAIPVDWISLNDIGPLPETTVVLIEPEFPPQAHEIFARHAHENPLLQRYQRTGDGRAYRFSDVTTPGQLQATALYREFYGPIGLQHQIAFTLPAAPDRLLALALSRRNDDFTEDERDLLNLARPYLIQAFRNAVDHSELLTELKLRRQAPQLPLSARRLAAQFAEQGITEREAEVLGVVASGFSDRATAELIGVSERTVQKHLQRCYRKLGVHGRRHAAELAWSTISDSRRIAEPGA